MNIAIVTGASSGMGKEFVLQLPGYVTVDEIWVIARRTGALEALQTEVSVPLRPISLDLCQPESFAALSRLLEAEKQVGARYMTLFTGTSNHARQMYRKAGFREVRTFAVMEKEL